MNSDPKKFKAPFIRREEAWRMADQTREKHFHYIIGCNYRVIKKL